MKIVFISHFFFPHIGGVEKHLYYVSKCLVGLGHDVHVITSTEDEKLKLFEKVDGINVHRFSYQKLKFIGLLDIWRKIVIFKEIIASADIVHIHDVFIWYIPLILIYPFKKFYITNHGWEGAFPIPIWNIINKKAASYLSSGTISVGRYIDKYYGIKSDKYVYGGVDKGEVGKKVDRIEDILFLGRLEKDTGLLDFLSWLNKNKRKVTFIGDGSLKNECKKYGTVLGLKEDLSKYIARFKYCVPSGYLSYLEAKSAGCKIITFPTNKLKVDYWKEIHRIKRIPDWNSVADVYLKVWQKN